MKKVTAKQLKQHTGAIIKMVRAGEKLTLTYRGKPIAFIQPAEADSIAFQTSQFDEAWIDIETALTVTAPKFENWQEATGWVRNRT